MAFELRDYQAECADGCRRDWGRFNSLMANLPTGMGKTEVFVDIASQWEDGRVLVVAPMIELVGQAAKKIAKRTGIFPGIEQGAMRSNESESLRSPFVVASKQSLMSRSKRYQRIEGVGLVIVDECHLAVTEPWADLIEHYADLGAKVLGVTATPKRHDGRALGRIFEHCSYSMEIGEALPLGWLVPAKAQVIQIEAMDLADVGTKGSRGDFKDGELAKIMEQDRVIFEIAAVTARESEGLKTVVFCATVNEAEAISNHLCDRHGVKAGWVCGDLKRCPKDIRQETLRSFTQDPGGIQIVCNVGVLTTGWDFCGLQHIVMARPTNSLALYTQIFGRGTRPLEGVVDFEGSTPASRVQAIADSDKPHFKVTDLCDVTLQHKLISVTDVLGGKMSLGERKRTKELMQKAGEAQEFDVVAREAKKQIAEEYAAAERAKRARIAAAAKYKSTSVDPFSRHSQRSEAVQRANAGKVMPWGKHKGKLLSEVPGSYLQWVSEQKWFWTHGKPFTDSVLNELGRGPAQKQAMTPMDAVLAKLKELRAAKDKQQQ